MKSPLRDKTDTHPYQFVLRADSVLGMFACVSRPQ